MNPSEDIISEIKEIIEKMLYFIGVSARSDVYLETNENGEVYRVDLSGDDLGALIGYHGEGLLALQTVLALMVAKKFDKFFYINVDVNGYRQEREERLKDMTKRAVDKVLFSLSPVELPPMGASERRLIHMEVSKHRGVASESTGEGFGRRVVIKPS
ncbi:hypothetical protein A2716_02830 [candidate division WWE3 bacterium RIFCSPHIGHO2_01_FULL_40_23]|uniref:R3H domain-containing protein n=1 Tax=candidate division WWE3 bacterium RIFCSPLOWO2_01_FULL_41_18 TaxID=1802625 RepID=A0A1F4VG18_UNCKA|nr:MAG: hypothetical protein A2716_02830 [candidate division WWE3 bacterium RIFCSPHIGHO2_01_FULL_40_23]OGC55920.1 MAG: hypothetical protein A3A78_02680 [candidate division WWE3 bacterium RIFCSPLOWO2_01_FULL_41_18]